MTQLERPPLTRRAVVAAALSVIDRGGLNACTMRAVASELGVEAMSLYWHVENKDDLLDGVLELVLTPIIDAESTGGGWQDTMTGFAQRFRATMIEHPNVAPLMAQRPATAYAAAKQGAVIGIRQLEEDGFELTEAVDAMRVLMRFVFGFTMVETVQGTGESAIDGPTSPEMHALLSSVTQEPPGRLFSIGLSTLVRGIEASRNGA